MRDEGRRETRNRERSFNTPFGIEARLRFRASFVPAPCSPAPCSPPLTASYNSARASVLFRLGGALHVDATGLSIRSVRCRGHLVCMAVGGVGSEAVPPQNFEQARNRMVDDEVVGAGIKNPRVIQSMRNTPRHEFVPIKLIDKAYFDMSLPIGEHQTISPPMIVAYMTEQLDPQPTDRVLEIGTGSGYQAAVLSPLVKEVYSIEIVESLGKHAAQTLKRLKYTNVFTKIGDGYLGWPEHAPFDKIIVTCSPEKVPQALIDQLKEGGRMVVPVGERYQQVFHLLTKARRQADQRSAAADAVRSDDRQGRGRTRSASPTRCIRNWSTAASRKSSAPAANRPAGITPAR